ncbi:hypothetical protein [Naasia sp. SYSU D00948]|uniref:hypothetical protein n=1 Tax=Naasia sp. SYSU D00948 TaxID=2817379 RepID=UPI001B313DBC|nr:hypothetical protein [Naasia sp. SYSU D00948]
MSAGRPAPPRHRLARLPAWVAAFGLVLLLVATGAVLARPAGPGAPARPDEGCPEGFPLRMTPEGEGMYAAAVGRFLVCQDLAGTSTLLRNRTAAVWALESPSGIAIHRERVSALDGSFLDVVRSQAAVVPAGASVAVPAPASALIARVDARLTIAALAHERLATALVAAVPPDVRGRVLTESRAALTACLAEVLDLLPNPGAALSGGNPGRRITDVVEQVAQTPDSLCVGQWTLAKLLAGVPLAAAAPLRSDVALWRHDPSFAFRALDAGITYSALGPRLLP